MANKTIQGSCLCGKVAYTISGSINRFMQCHCSRCRKMSGTAYASNLFVDAALVEWIRGEDAVLRYELPTAEYFATAFCRTCGSHMPHRTSNGNGYVIPAGALDDDPGVTPERIIYWASRAPWFVHTDTLEARDVGL